MSACEVCGCRLYEKNRLRHLAKVHNVQVTVPSSPAHAIKKSMQKPKANTCINRPQSVSPPDDHDDHDDHDERDASKYLGYFAREHGRFGSMPMYDDYGDEGDPD